MSDSSGSIPATSAGRAVRSVRAVHGATRVPGEHSPFDTVHFRVFHPAAFTGDDTERLTGNVAADPSGAPWPVVIVLPGINIGPEGYKWLAVSLASTGLAVVTMALVGETMPGVIGITPGLDLEACRPDSYGTRPTATALGPLLDALGGMNEHGRLEAMLDVSRVVLGGHSGGGTVALQNANPAWFPGVIATFAYASHTMASTFLGYEPSTILPLPAHVPALLLAGELDGVMARSADRYAAGGPDHDPVRRTFDEAVQGGNGDCAFGVIRGATHTSLVWPRDDTTARGFLDPEPGREAGLVRETIGALIGAFVAASTRTAGHRVTDPSSDPDRLRLAALLGDADSVIESRIK